jgi:hypothetical protein
MRDLIKPATLVAVVGLLSLCGCGQAKSLPPLLQNLESRGGYADACPVPADLQLSVQKLGLADSPEFDKRLEEKYPSGSSSAVLRKSLAAIGFRSIGACKDDESIQIARFDEARSQSSSFSLDYPMTATVFWKVDTQDRVIWTKGFVFYTGL